VLPHDAIVRQRGSQLEKTGVNAGKTYLGGAQQYEFYDYLGGGN
jgi:hypothetical protein